MTISNNGNNSSINNENNLTSQGSQEQQSSSVSTEQNSRITEAASNSLSSRQEDLKNIKEMLLKVETMNNKRRKDAECFDTFFSAAKEAAQKTNDHPKKEELTALLSQLEENILKLDDKFEETDESIGGMRYILEEKREIKERKELTPESTIEELLEEFESLKEEAEFQVIIRHPEILGNKILNSQNQINKIQNKLFELIDKITTFLTVKNN